MSLLTKSKAAIVKILEGQKLLHVKIHNDQVAKRK